MVDSRRKGHNFERWVARVYRAAFPGMDVYRGQQGAGAHEADVSHDLLWTECKRQRKVTAGNIRKALDQAIRDAGDSGKLPVAVTKADRDEVLVTMRFQDFVDLVKMVQQSWVAMPKACGWPTQALLPGEEV